MDDAMLGTWMRRFLLEHVVAERNLSRNTQRSYRDTFCLLLPFVTNYLKKSNDRLLVADVTGECVRKFLADLETNRGCSARTRNQRLAALHAFARFVGDHNPELVPWCREVRLVPFKRADKNPLTYLEKNEMDAILAAANLTTKQGRRDHAVILFLYNSGARASEAAAVTIGDVELDASGSGTVTLQGKGRKTRFCPLWTKTMGELQPLMNQRTASDHLFLNRYGRPLSRFGIRDIVKRHAILGEEAAPSLTTKRVSPHIIRHTTATHLLRSGVDINTIRAWLGHVSLETTNIYAEIDLEAKANALAACEMEDSPIARPWREDPDLMRFLRDL
jgi:site-specific recombinase XerD